MNQYRLQIVSETSELTLIVVENITTTSTPSNKMFWCSVSLNTEAIVIKDSTGVRAINTSGNRIDMKELVEKVGQLQNYI